MDDPAPMVSELEEKNALALAIVPVSGIQFISHGIIDISFLRSYLPGKRIN